MADIPSRSAQGFPALFSHGFERIGRKRSSLAELIKAMRRNWLQIQFIKAAVALPKRIS
jgi:uncharacterized membrane protein